MIYIHHQNVVDNGDLFESELTGKMKLVHQGVVDVDANLQGKFMVLGDGRVMLDEQKLLSASEVNHVNCGHDFAIFTTLK